MHPRLFGERDEYGFNPIEAARLEEIIISENSIPGGRKKTKN
jgi:hypothetical protein